MHSFLVKKHVFMTLVLAVLYLLLWLSEVKAAHRIIVMTDSENNQQIQSAGFRGVVTGLGMTYEEGTNQYSLTKGYQLELLSYSQRNPLITLSQADEVIAIICQTVSDCRPALDNTAAKDVLVIASHSSGGDLKGSDNLMRVPASSQMQHLAIYQKMKQDQVKNFVVIHEPHTKILQHYNEFLSNYYSDVQFEQQRPNWVASFPLTDQTVLAPQQQGMTETTLAQLIPQLQVDGIVFIGAVERFQALTQTNTALTSFAWYINELPIITGFANLQMFTPYRPQQDESLVYYTAFDTGAFLKKVITSYMISNGVAQRKGFLAVARETVLAKSEAKTGMKTFSNADTMGSFLIQRYDAQGQPAAVEFIEVKAK